MNGGFNGYQSDTTRVWRIGDVPAIAVKAHECSRRILRRLEAIGRPGCPVSDLYHEAMKIVEEDGLEKYFIGPHAAGRLHRPRSGHRAERAACYHAAFQRHASRRHVTLAIEPKFVIPEIGAVGVENTYVVAPDGLQNITPFPEEIQEL